MGLDLPSQIVEETAKQVSGDLKRLITDGVRLSELLPVLNAYLKDHHGCVIGNRYDYPCGVMDMRAGYEGKILLRHVSLAVCLEFALKQSK